MWSSAIDDPQCNTRNSAARCRMQHQRCTSLSPAPIALLCYNGSAGIPSSTVQWQLSVNANQNLLSRCRSVPAGCKVPVAQCILGTNVVSFPTSFPSHLALTTQFLNDYTRGATYTTTSRTETAPLILKFSSSQSRVQDSWAYLQR